MNILFVSIAFPPKSDSECLQTAKYYYQLQKKNELAIEVVTSALPTLYMRYDKSLEKYNAGAKNIVSLTLKENRYINFLRHRLGLTEMVFPDVKQSFHQQAEKVPSLLKQKPQLIYSRSYPLSSAIMAFKLKEKLNIPWVMHLSDPWVGSPFHMYSPKYYKKCEAWEKRCIETADYLCLTSLSTIRFYQKKYPAFRDKFVFFPNVYELPEANTLLSDNEEMPGGETKKLRILYTGGMAGDRSPAYLLEPLKQLYKERPDIAGKLQVEFAGEADLVNRNVFKNYQLPFVSYLGKLPYTETLEKQKRANYLVIIDNPFKDPAMAMFFPSKLLDYMVAKKRILAITTKGSSTDEVMADLKGDICGHSEVEKIKNCIVNALDAFDANESNFFKSDAVPEKYEAGFNADRLVDLFKTLVNE